MTTTVKLADGRIVDVDDSKATVLIREGRATRVDSPEAAALRPTKNYALRHPQAHETR